MKRIPALVATAAVALATLTTAPAEAADVPAGRAIMTGTAHGWCTAQLGPAKRRAVVRCEDGTVKRAARVRHNRKGQRVVIVDGRAYRLHARINPAWL